MKRVLVGLAMAVIASGCEQQAVRVEKVEPGSECPNGGLRLLVNNNPPELVCNGANGTSGNNGTNGTNGTDGTNGSSGSTTLLTQTTLAPDDARCPRGGVEVQAGPDSGGDGGVANDGVLQGGEVTSSAVVCNGDDGARVGSFVPPAGPAGTAVIRANGGAGNSGEGGQGGNVLAQLGVPTNGGHVKVWKTGRASAAFTVPTPSAADLGATPLRITADTSIPYTTDPAMAGNGNPFINEDGLFISQGQLLAPRPVTGLSVAAGVTLTLPLMFSLPQQNQLGSCRIDGTVTWSAMATASNGNNFGLACGEVVLSASSRVDAVGELPNPSVSVGFRAMTGQLLALGPIDASADPLSNATGGSIVLDGLSLYVAGNLTANGINGGSGGYINLRAPLMMANEGTLSARAISTGTRGGSGGTVSLAVTSFLGELRNRGAIDVSGASASCGECTGGSGGSVRLTTASTALINDAAITARGGDGDQGGSGGYVNLVIGGESARAGRPGSLLVSGTIDASGGAGGLGGNGGTVRISGDYGMADGAEVVLLGYATLEANGGSGSPGAPGGTIEVRQQSGSLPAGAVLVTSDLVARGGETDPMASTSMAGGTGGNISLVTAQELASARAFWEQVRTSGNMNVAGGQGPIGGIGGYLSIVGVSGVTASGAFDARGGLGTAGNGGNGGGCNLMSTSGRVDSAVNTDTSAGSSGGNFVSAPGEGGGVQVLGVDVTNSGTHRARGGSGNLMGGVGGRGGTVIFAASTGHTTQNTVAAPAGIDVSGGAAATPGNAGQVSIDGVLVTSQWTH